MRRILSVLTAGALALAGCTTDEAPDEAGSPAGTASPDTPSETAAPTTSPSPTSTPTPSPTDGVAAMEFTPCEAQEFTIAHPVDWQTNDPGGLVAACRVFHPGPVDLPDEPQDISLHWAASLHIDNVPFEEVTGAEPTGEVLSSRDTTVAGRDARVSEVRSSGEALAPEEALRYGYAVDLGGRTLFAHTYSVGETDYERDKRVLDRMVEGLELTATEPVAGPATTEPSTEQATGEPVTVTGLEVGGHTGFDRLVFEIGGEGQAGWDIAYESEPRAQGSGEPVEVAGDATLRVTLTGVALPPDAPEEPRDGPQRVQPEGTSAVREVLDGTVFEGRHSFFVGLDEQRPYSVERLTDPQRVVIDVQTG